MCRPRTLQPTRARTLRRQNGSLKGSFAAQAATWRVCHTRVLSLAWRRRGAAQEQPWGARQRLAGWRRAWQAYLADLPGWRQSAGPCAAALSASDNPPHNKICGVLVVRFWSRPWDCRISVNFRF